MKRANWTLFLAGIVILVAAGSAIADGEGEPIGVMAVDPPAPGSCIAVRVQLASEQSLTGVRWYGQSAAPFQRVLAGSGAADLPPVFADAQVVAENVTGAAGWNDLDFDIPVASLTGALYVIFEYPAEISGPGDVPAIGYAATEEDHSVYISADGDDWVKMAADYRLLVEPDLGMRTPGMFALSAPRVAVIQPAKPQVTVSPNPFNPETRIVLRNLTGKAVEVSVYDLQGNRVRKLYKGVPSNVEEFVAWDGRDEQGRRQSSGVYVVRTTGAGIDLQSRAVLVK